MYFTNEFKEYYLRELEKITGLSVGNIRRELNKLKEDKLFLTRRNGNQLYYQLNQKHPFYKIKAKKLIQANAAKITGTGRTVITAVVNGNLQRFATNTCEPVSIHFGPLANTR